jgi:hypothetical protein
MWSFCPTITPSNQEFPSCVHSPSDPEIDFGKQSKVPKLRAFSIAFSITD